MTLDATHAEPLEDVSTSETDADYLQWSCDRLQHLLDQEEARRVGLERKAMAAAAFALALASFFAQQVAGLVSWFSATTVPAGAALLFLVCALLYTYRTVAIKRHKAPNPRILCDDDVCLQPASASYLGYQRHLRDVLVAAREQHDIKGDLSDKAQQWSLLTAAALVLALLTHAFTATTEHNDERRETQELTGQTSTQYQ